MKFSVTHISQFNYIYQDDANDIKIINLVIFLEFYLTKQGLPLVDSWSRGLY